MDEPDTHLNPVWTYEYLDLLDESIDTTRGHLIVSTHNPLMIGGLHRGQVRTLVSEGVTLVAREPEYDPIGLGVEGLLKSELYGLRSTLAPEVLERLDRHYGLMAMEDRTEEQTRELRSLSVQLNSMAVSRTHPNPYFNQFADALARRRSSSGYAPLTREELMEQKGIADEVLAEVLAEEAAGDDS